MYSFVELYERRNAATFRDLEETLADYVDSGSHIAAWVVIDILKTMGLTSGELNKLRSLCLAGQKDQADRGQAEAARQYALVADRIDKRLKAMV